MKLSVIIIGYNSWHYLAENLASLAFLEQDRESEIIYTDNGSTDGTLAHIESLYPFVKVIKNSTNKGISAARNQGINIARGQYIWILDSDTEVSENALAQMLEFMDNHREVGLCGCKMYGQDGTVQSSCRKFPSIVEKTKAGIHIVGKKIGLNVFPHVIEDNSYDTNQALPFEVDYVIGACQLVRKEAQERAGMLDEKIFYGPEDADFCLRIHKVGYKVYYLPNISIYHAYQRTSSHQLFSKITWKHVQGLLYYFRKHRS